MSATAHRPPRWRVRSTNDHTRLHPWVARRSAALGDPWYVETPHGFYSGSFETWATAWRYACTWANDPEAELRTEAGA